MIVKTIIIVLLLAILAALMTSLVFLIRDPSQRRRALTGLKVRVALSVTLILFLLLSWSQGWINPHPALPPSSGAAPSP